MLIVIEDVTLIKNTIVYFKHNNIFLNTQMRDYKIQQITCMTLILRFKDPL
jgi:hypothetical protein